MPTKSQTVDTGDPNSGQNDTDRSTEERIRRLEKRNERLEQMLELLKRRKASSNSDATGFSRQCDHVISKTLMTLETDNAESRILAVKRIIRSQGMEWLLKDNIAVDVTEEIIQKAETAIKFVVMTSLSAEIEAQILDGLESMSICKILEVIEDE